MLGGSLNSLIRWPPEGYFFGGVAPPFDWSGPKKYSTFTCG